MDVDRDGNPSGLRAYVVVDGLVSRLDHAAYLGSELARAEFALDSGARYVQGGAPEVGEQSGDCGCGPSCGG